jgi:hypothetical protein
MTENKNEKSEFYERTYVRRVPTLKRAGIDVFVFVLFGEKENGVTVWSQSTHTDGNLRNKSVTPR